MKNSSYDQEKLRRLLVALDETFPDCHCELDYKNPYELLIAVILSAQCTDKRVNAVTPALFEYCNDPKEMAKKSPEDIIPYIRSCGFYNNKSKSIINCSKELVELYDGVVPADRDKLEALSGVGRKTANVVYAEAFGGDAIAVDTHVFRVSNRLGLVESKTPEETEKQLTELLPKSEWRRTHHRLIFLGRYMCKAQKPACSECPFTEYCKYYLKQGV